MNYEKKALALHKKKRGKIEIVSKVSLKTKEDLSVVYTPGVGAVSLAVAKNKKKSFEMTNRGNQVAIVSDGSAVLGLGDIGPAGAMPVMEGKAVIFKEFAGVDAVPLCVNTKDVDGIVEFCKLISPSFGGVNLEDISAPRCFDILKRLEKESEIVVFHDDQDGTAIVVLAALINACKVTGKDIKKVSVVMNGNGAAGMAIAKLLLSAGVKDLVIVDSKGLLYKDRGNLNSYKTEIAKKTNKKQLKGSLEDAVVGRDVFIGVSKAGVLSIDMVKSMNSDPIIFAMANPNPEIMPKDALKACASIVGTGRSDFPNQINNALVFPGLFRGLLDGRIKKVTKKMKISVAEALAKSVKPTKDKILPALTDKKNVKVIANSLS